MPSQYRIQYRWDDDITNRSQGRRSSRTSTALRVARLKDGNSHLTVGGVMRGRAARVGGDSVKPARPDADLLWSLTALRRDVAAAAAAAVDTDADGDAGKVSRVFRRSSGDPAGGVQTGQFGTGKVDEPAQAGLRPGLDQGGQSSSSMRLATCVEEREESEPAKSADSVAAGENPQPAVTEPASSSIPGAVRHARGGALPRGESLSVYPSPVTAGKNGYQPQLLASGSRQQKAPLGPSLADRRTYGPLERVVLPAGYCLYFAPGQGGTLLQSDPNKGVTTRAGQKILGVIDPASRNVHHVVEEEYAVIREVVEMYVEQQLRAGEQEESHRYRVGGHREEHRRLLEHLARGTADIADVSRSNIADRLALPQADRQGKPRAEREDQGAVAAECEHAHDGSWTGRRDLLPISKALTAALPRRDGRQMLVEGEGLSAMLLHQQSLHAAAGTGKVATLRGGERGTEDGWAQEGPLTVEKLPLTSREEEQERQELQEREKLGIDLVKSLDLARNVHQKYPDPRVVERYHQQQLEKKAGRRSTRFRFLPRRTVPLQVVSSRSPLATRRSLDTHKNTKTSWRNASDAEMTVVTPLTPLQDGSWLNGDGEINHSETYLSGKPPSPAFQLRDKRAWSLIVSRRGAPRLEPVHPLVSSAMLYSARGQGLNEDGGHSSVTRSDSKMILNVVLPREDSPPPEGRVRLCGRNVSQQHGPPVSVGNKPCTCSLQYAWPLAGVSPPPAPPPSAPTNPDLLGLEASETGQFLFVEEEEAAAGEEDAFEGDDELDSDDEDLDSGHGQSDARSVCDSQRLSLEEPFPVSAADASIAAPLSFGHRFFSDGEFNRSKSSIQPEKSDIDETLPEPIKNPDLHLKLDELHSSHQSAEIVVLSEGSNRRYERAGFPPVKSSKSTTTEYKNTSEQQSVNTLIQNGPTAALLDPDKGQIYLDDNATLTSVRSGWAQLPGLPQAKTQQEFLQGATWSPSPDHEPTDVQEQALGQPGNDLEGIQGGTDPVLLTGSSLPLSSSKAAVPVPVSHAEERQGPPRRSSPSTCKRAAHCDLLGPDLCPDCDAVLQRYQFSVRQSAMFPDINVFPKHMVASQRMRGGKRPAFGVLGGAYAGLGGVSDGARPRAAAGLRKGTSASSRWPYVSVVQLDQVVTERDLCRRVVEKGEGASNHRPQ